MMAIQFKNLSKIFLSITNKGEITMSWEDTIKNIGAKRSEALNEIIKVMKGNPTIKDIRIILEGNDLI